MNTPARRSQKMTYYVSRTIDGPYEAAVTAVRDALAHEGFGVITEIDIAKTMMAKLGVVFRPYRILGACNPALAHQALMLEDKVGTMLPCNVIVQEVSDGLFEVAAIDPVASMSAIDNPALKAAAAGVAERLRAAMARLPPAG
jgi:uncharacterized protein (DUF302 family)